MKTKNSAVGLGVGVLLSAAVGAAHAQVIKVEDAWVRATVAGQRATGAFMQLTADQDMTLVSVSADIAGVAQIHEMAMTNNIMRMSQIKGGLPLPAGQTVSLQPGGHHLMLLDLKQAVQVDDQVAITLNLRDANGQEAQQSLTLPAMPLGAMKSGAGAQVQMKHGEGMRPKPVAN